MNAGAVLVSLALVVLPGAGVSLLVGNSRPWSVAVQAAAAIPFGYLLTGGIAFVLALAHVLYLWTFLVLVAVATLAAWWYALRSRGWRDRFAAWRAEVAADRWPFVMLAVSILALLAVRLTYSAALDLHDQTPLRYWADGLEIADAHRIPALSLQWGHLFPTTISKVLLNSFDAAASLVLGRGPVAPMTALLFVVFLGIVLAAFALARELGLRFTAPLFVLVLFANRVRGNRELTLDLVHYRAEDMGRLLMVVAVLFTVLALRSGRFRDGRREALIAGVVFGGLAGTHLVPFAVGLTLAGAYGLARIAVDRRPRATLQLGGAIVGIALVVGALVLISPRGDLGFQGVGDSGAYRRLAVELGQRPCWDPTLFLTQGRLEQYCQGTGPGTHVSTGTMYRTFAGSSLGLVLPGAPYLVLVPLLYALSVGLARVFGSRDLRAGTLAAALAGTAILVVALVVASRSKVYVVALFGPRRLFDYAGIPVAVLGLAIVELAVGWLGRVRLNGARRPWLAAASAGAAFAIALGILLPRDVQDRGFVRYIATAEGPLTWIERNVPCDGMVLADRRTLATFEVFARHAGILEGMGPYLRPDLLTTAIRRMIAARAFFLDPAAGEPYLRRSGIAAIVVTEPNQPIGGASKVGRFDPNELSSLPFLRLAARSASVTVYRVVGFDPVDGHGPDTAKVPGYACDAPA